MNLRRPATKVSFFVLPMLAVSAALHAQTAPADSAYMAGTAIAAEAANQMASKVVLPTQAALVLGTGAIIDSPATIAERVARQAEREMNIASAVAESNNRLFTQFAWVSQLMNAIATVQNTVEQIKQMDDTLALAVSMGADYLEFINSLSGPRGVNFFYDSATIAQVNRAINEFRKLKDWNISFTGAFSFPTNRVAQPTGVTWDTINRRLGAAVDKMDSAIDEISPLDAPTRKGLQFASNNAVLSYGTQTVQKGTAFIARNAVQQTKIQHAQMRLLREIAELDGRKTDAQVLKETQAEIATNAGNVAGLARVQDAQTRALAVGMAQAVAAKPAMGAAQNEATQKALFGQVFDFPVDDETQQFISSGGDSNYGVFAGKGGF